MPHDPMTTNYSTRVNQTKLIPWNIHHFLVRYSIKTDDVKCQG